MARRVSRRIDLRRSFCFAFSRFLFRRYPARANSSAARPSSPLQCNPCWRRSRSSARAASSALGDGPSKGEGDVPGHGGGQGLVLGHEGLASQRRAIALGHLRGASVDGPAPAALGRPAALEVLSGLGQVVGRQVEMGLFSGPAHGHIGQLATAAVLVDVGAVTGRPLAAMHGGGIAVGQALCPDLVAIEELTAAVVHLGGQTLALEVDGEHHAALGGDDLAVVHLGRASRSDRRPRSGHRRAARARGRRASPGPTMRSRARRFSSATLARRQANIAASFPTATSLAQRVDKLGRVRLRAGRLTTRPAAGRTRPHLQTSPARSSASAPRSA